MVHPPTPVTRTQLPPRELHWKRQLIMMDCRACCHHPRRQQQILSLVGLSGQVVPVHMSAKDPGLFDSPWVFGSPGSDQFTIRPTTIQRKLKLCCSFFSECAVKALPSAGCPSNLFRKKALSWLQILMLSGCFQPGKNRKKDQHYDSCNWSWTISQQENMRHVATGLCGKYWKFSILFNFSILLKHCLTWWTKNLGRISQGCGSGWPLAVSSIIGHRGTSKVSRTVHPAWWAMDENDE